MEKEASQNTPTSAKQEQIQSILFNREIGWQEIIYDLINTEQLDPWDIDLALLTDRYLERIRELEEADFFVSSKVLLAASLLLRIKSEILLNKYIRSIDDILFGRKEQILSKPLERIELEEEIPLLVPKSPIPRFKRVTLQELMESLNKAIKTENRRIHKEIVNKNALRETGISLPKNTFSIKDKIRGIYVRITQYFEVNKEERRVPYTSHLAPSKEEKVDTFFPLLQLENQKKVWLEQENHFEEVYIWMNKTYFKHNPDPFKDLREELGKEIEEIKDALEAETYSEFEEEEQPKKKTKKTKKLEDS